MTSRDAARDIGGVTTRSPWIRPRAQGLRCLVAGVLPQAELERLESAIGKECASLHFCRMRDADEEFRLQPAGLHEVTWAVILNLVSAPPLVITWAQDEHGNPNRLCLTESASLLAIDSVVAEDVSMRVPWWSVIGQACTDIRLHTYRSNHARSPSADTWHDVLWGLELRFPALVFLVAAATHGRAETEPMTNDELVVAYTPASIARLIAIRETYEEAWRDG